MPGGLPQLCHLPGGRSQQVTASTGSQFADMRNGDDDDDDGDDDGDRLNKNPQGPPLLNSVNTFPYTEKGNQGVNQLTFKEAAPGSLGRPRVIIGS